MKLGRPIGREALFGGVKIFDLNGDDGYAVF